MSLLLMLQDLVYAWIPMDLRIASNMPRRRVGGVSHNESLRFSCWEQRRRCVRRWWMRPSELRSLGNPVLPALWETPPVSLHCYRSQAGMNFAVQHNTKTMAVVRLDTTAPAPYLYWPWLYWIV